ncbi:DUF3944 domain-containing protein, partial [Tessaracoccus sp. OH4464_COT-324]|uniref:DUF3944 domain-containing protein n=1 Tax=Tessaracoccus sp. OH4464_COT-324 TaxID=2491059 RepID=UPI000F62CF33
LDSKDLDALVYCLTHDSDGKLRYTEELTKREKYKQFHPEHNKYWDDIAGELQCFGGNTFATFFKGGKGVLYSEILNDVCEKCKVSTKGSIVEKEDRILTHI